MLVHRRARRDREGVVPVGILRGAFCFLADLSRAIDLPVTIGCVALRSYEGASGGEARLTADLVDDIRGLHVIVVEDIIERGTTLNLALRVLAEKRPATLTVCALLRKPAAAIEPVPGVAYIGFEIGDEFVVGYGLDYNQRFRNLPYVGVPDEADLAR